MTIYRGCCVVPFFALPTIDTDVLTPAVVRYDKESSFTATLPFRDPANTA